MIVSNAMHIEYQGQLPCIKIRQWSNASSLDLCFMFVPGPNLSPFTYVLEYVFHFAQLSVALLIVLNVMMEKYI